MSLCIVCGKKPGVGQPCPACNGLVCSYECAEIHSQIESVAFATMAVEEQEKVLKQSERRDRDWRKKNK